VTPGAANAAATSTAGVRRLPAMTVAGLAAVALAVAALAGCAAPPGQGTPGRHAAGKHVTGAGSNATAGGGSGAGQGTRAGTEVAAGSAGAGSAGACDPKAASLAPPPGPPRVTGSWMAAVRKRGYLVAGVDQSTYHFGYLNPLDGKIEGFDIDMIRAVAQAIFGDPDKVQYKAISDADRIPDVAGGSVDIVAHTMTITCDRLEKIGFSGVYFEAHQRVLVLADSRATGLADLGGQKVCATKGSDSAKFIADYPSHPRLITVSYWTDCLVRLQQRDVAAVSTDDTILNGLAAQDPFTKLVGPDLTDEPYGLAISKQHPEFVRFVNAVLARMYSDGAWEKSYNHWVSPVHVTPPVPKYAG
jgi:polar amino acid transport system substrate-binding protein